MECTSIKFELFWRKISRKDGCKGVSETALREQFRKLFKAHISALFLFAFLFLPPYSREKYHKIYQILLTYNPKCAARLVAIYASHQTRPL